VDDEGRIYVADFVDKVVRVLSPGGQQLAYIGASSMGNPVDVTLNAAGDLYVATQSPDQILKFSPSSTHG
jgi:predicted methyltransferase